MRAARGRSLPPPVAEEGKRSAGNRKERLRDYASSPEGCKPLPISFGVCPKGAREMMFFVFLPMQVCVSRLASTACRQYFVDKLKRAKARFSAFLGLTEGECVLIMGTNVRI